MDSDRTDGFTCPPKHGSDALLCNRKRRKEYNQVCPTMDELDGDNNFFMNDVDYADYQYCSTPEQNTDDELDDESSPQEFTITDMRRIAGGFIINSNVYISDDHWETIVTLDNAKRLYCAVCDLYINVENCEKHLATPAHGINKFKNAPMKRFELSMTRKIKQGYHCGVCNITFDDPDAHSETKKHLEKMLFAINKANDLLYDSFNNTVRNETIKLPDSNPSYGNDYEYFNNTVIFDNNNDDENNNDESDKDDENNNDESDKDDKDSNNNSDLDFAGESIWQTTISYAQIAKTETEKVPKELKIDLGDKIVTVKYDSWNMIVYTSRNSFYCMACKDTGVRRAKFEHCISEPHLARLSACKVVRAYETHLVRRVGENLFHCGHCNNLQPMHEMEIHIEEKHPKLRLRVDKHKLEHELGENIENNTQRPILKNEATPIKNKMMKSVQFVDENNVPTNKMKENYVPNQSFQEKSYVSTNFTKKTEEFNNENTIPSLEITENGILKHSETHNGCPVFSFMSFDKPPPNYKPVDSKQEVLSSLDVQPKIFNGSIMLTCQFGFQIYVSVESFNTILRQNDVIKCLVCDMSLDGEPQDHMFHELHVEMLQRVAFIPEFTCNLIRLLRNQIHCVICNTTILNDRKSITNHISGYEHGLLLKKALFLRNAPASFSEPGFGVCKDIQIVPPPPPPPPPFIVEPPPDFQDETVVEEIDPDHANRQADYRYVIVKLRNVYLKVQEDGWHTLVYRGDGTNYCFCCDQIVLNTEVYNHMNTKGHAKSVDGHLVLDMYGINLLRQVENLYHCAFCNVIISKKNLESHLKWSPHLENTEQALITAPDRRSRDMERMMGIFEVEALTQKEKYDGITDNVKDAILYNVQITKKRNTKNNEFTEKRSKIVIFNNDVYKIDFDNWNGFVVSKDGYKCNLCNCEFKKGGLESHFGSKIHADNVEKPILKVEAYGLVREVSDHMLYCVLCNLSLTKKDISSHCGGKRHAKSLEVIRDSSGEDQYSDCHEEPYIV